MTKLLTLFLLVLVTSVGCMPEQAMRRPVSVENNNVANTDTEEEEQAHQAAEAKDIFWQDNGYTSKILTIDESDKKNVYIQSDYLSDQVLSTEYGTKSICAIAKFQATLDKSPKELRVLLIPQTTYDSAKGKSVRYYKANLSDKGANQLCNLTKFDKENITLPIAYSNVNVANSLEDVCTNCLNIITSISFVIYETSFESATGPNNIIYTSGLISELDTQWGFENLTIRVDMNNNSSNNTPSCNNTDCQAQGFDCCLQGQCVKDAGLKNTRVEVQQISNDLNDPTYLTQFDYAESQKVNNPLLYLQYPQYYYICLENVPNDGSSGPLDPSDPAGDARKRLKEMISDFYCVEELKANSAADPFHTDPYNSTASYKTCNTSDDPNASPDMYYKDVMERLYKHCGCVSDTYNEMVANCPKYTYKEVYTSGTDEYKLSDAYALMVTKNVSSLLNIEDLADITNIARIECVSPEVDPNILPFQEMNVIVNSKTAPHRFFDANTDSNNESIEITDMNELPIGASGVQEGDTFQYLDDEKMFPLNGAFNMNSILGQMTVDLTQARPARVIDLEFDKMYYIATIDGYFTPCPSCAKDSWFPNFSPNPMSTQGVGLQSLGYTTRRDAWGSNTTFGNYEDTIFGRACWLPPTMIPFSHDEHSDQQTQRLNRLKTQSAYFVNGYQRDWYGFNKGALIGSFDGVSWFAVGKGRVVKSSTNKLFLAINAPFADLTQYNDHIVSVQEWDFITTGPQYDYNPDENINSVFQNEAGLCQRNHQCEKDSDCITQLGWEYSCVDVNQYTTKWPQFSPTGANEVANSSREGTLISFLAQAELPPGTSAKKCVYRGAGSPCRIDYDEITDLEKRKSLACAPNFYCAALSHGSTYNSEVARYAGVLQDISVSKNHYFGRDANHLGRPLDYISTGNLNSLPSTAQTAIDENLTTIDSSGTGDFGICRPGKSLPDYASATATTNEDFIEQQKSADTEFRTDYISQIAGCNSSLYTNLRFSSCPMLDEDGNYLHLRDDYRDNAILIDTILPLDTYWNRKGASQVYGHSQNSCGLEVLGSGSAYGMGVSADTLSSSSAFSLIEGKPLSSSDVHYEATLTRDACFRKAGAVCHTDLDCSPNYKHADLIDILNPSFFGNTAEKKYWQEYLVCGQGQKEPLQPTDPDFNTYDITNNRCCREIGKDMTMYTEDSPNAPESIGLQTDKFGSYHPNDPNRYSRYSNLNSHFMNEATRRPDGIFTRPSANTEKSSSDVLTNIVNLLDRKQWKTFNGSAKRTCCGGGWVRKFADGTNNWTVNRLNLDVTNFRCLNFRTPLVNTDSPEPFGLTNTYNNQDSQNLCLDSTMSAANCAQLQFPGIDWSPQKPIIDNTPEQMVLQTVPDDMNTEWQNNLWAFMPLMIIDEGDPTRTWLDWSSDNPNNDPEAGAQRRNLSFKIPSFVTWPNNSTFDSDIKIELEAPTDSENDFVQCTAAPAPPSYTCGDNGAWHGLCGPREPSLNVSSDWASACPDNGTDHKNCCYVYNPVSRILKVAFNYQMTQNVPAVNVNGGNDPYNWKDLGMKVTFTAPGTLKWEQENITGAAVNQYSTLDSNGFEIINHRRSASPGNSYYYLKKLENFELLGIPQISYQPLYCNDNYQKMVPGLFKAEVNGSPLTNIVEFINHPDTFLAEATTRPSASEARPYAGDAAGGIHNASSLNEPRLATQELVNHEPIFSDNEFMCCSPLGTEVTQDQSGNCCSGYAAEATSGSSSSSSGGTSDPNAKVICKLPGGADLNVYFNKFISGEGMSEAEETPLTEEDFDEHTGYPLFNETVLQKLKALAQTHCESGDYAQGGAFGPFVAEPHGSLGKQGGADNHLVYSIVDSIYDDGSNNDRLAGFDTFNQGLRWNHHIYCAPGAAQ